MNDLEEIWKDIKGFEGIFQVSNQGRVKRLEHTVKAGWCLRTIEEKIIEPFTWQSRYLRVDLRYKIKNKTKRRATYIHTLVAEAFIGPRPKGLVIDHINRDYLDNRVSNLRYVTYKENNNNCDKGKCKGRKYVSKDCISKIIKPEEIQDYINNGWHFGSDNAKHKHIIKDIEAYKDAHRKKYVA